MPSVSSPGLLGHDLLVQPPKRRILRARRDAEVILDDHTVVEVRRLERGLLGQGEVVHPARLLELEGAPAPSSSRKNTRQNLSRTPSAPIQISRGTVSAGLRGLGGIEVRTRDS